MNLKNLGVLLLFVASILAVPVASALVFVASGANNTILADGVRPPAPPLLFADGVRPPAPPLG
ncbi:MAG: hypothetical protein WBS18_13065 [Candidatus Acidiferrales bacterium]